MADLDTTPILAEVAKLDLQAGDILTVKVGIPADQMGECNLPWIPTNDELLRVAQDVELVVPEGVKTMITHLGVNYEIVCGLDESTTLKVERISADDFTALD